MEDLQALLTDFIGTEPVTHETVAKTEKAQNVTDKSVKTEEYVPIGDSTGRYKYKDYPTVPPRTIDLLNINPTIKDDPLSFYEWTSSFDKHKEKASKDYLERQKQIEEANAKYISKYQYDNPSAPFYIDREDKFYKEHPTKDLIYFKHVETLLDVIYEHQQKQKQRKETIEHYQENSQEVVNHIVKNTLNTIKKIEHDDYVENSGTKDRKTDKEATWEHRQKFNESGEYVGDKKDKIALSPLDMFEIGLGVIKNYYGDKIKITYTGEGNFGGIEFGFASDFPRSVGLMPPIGKKFYKSINYVDRKLISLLCPLDREIRTFWFGAFSGDANRSAIAKFARIAPSSTISTQKTVSIDGNLACKVVPPLEWFSEEVQAINPRYLLGILPDKEANTLLIHLGRIAYGIAKENPQADLRSPNKVIELPGYEYDYRTACLIHGDPGTGKSKLLEYIAKGFTSVGYTYDYLGTQFNQFGWNVILNDLVLCDDLNEASIKKLLSSDKLKSAISGNGMQVETKGVDGRKVMSKGNFIFSTNHIIFPETFDAGISNRIHFLQTYSQKQLIQRSAQKGFSCFTVGFWNQMKAKFNVDTTTLALYLIRCGLDEFLKVSGIYKITNENETRWDWDKERIEKGLKPALETRLDQNRANYVFIPPTDEKDYLTEMARKAFVYTRVLRPDLNVPDEYDDSFSAFTLKHLAETMKKIHQQISTLESSEITGQTLDFLKASLSWITGGKKVISKTIWYQYSNFWITNIGENLSLGSSSKLTFEEIWDKMITLVTTQEGRAVCKQRSDYGSLFTKHKQDTEFFENEFKEIVLNCGIDLNDNDSSATKIIKNKCVAKFTSFDMSEVV